MKLTLPKKVEQLSEPDLKKRIKFYRIFSWLFFLLGISLPFTSIVISYSVLPRNPVTFTLPGEGFMPTAEANYLFLLLLNFLGIAISVACGSFLWIASTQLDVTVIHMKSELRIRGLETQLKELKEKT